MNIKTYYIYLFVILLAPIKLAAQSESAANGGWISVGVRNNLSLFDGDGTGLGVGGQFRIQFSNRINSDWYSDYIAINVQNKVRSEYLHIGWSVLYYPMEQVKFVQPYILAGHCFDYNKKTALKDATITGNRLGSAVQAGIGTHLNLSKHLDISLTCQYMIHLTKELETEIDGENVHIFTKSGSALQGHLLSTISINYKLFQLWHKK